MRGLVDTSVFVAAETGRWIDESGVPQDILVSVVTLAELHAGVLAAPDVETRARRLSTLRTASDLDVVGIDVLTAELWALMRVHLKESKRRVNVNDLWIAATAAAHGMPVVTQDDDFDPIKGIGGLEVIRV